MAELTWPDKVFKEVLGIDPPSPEVAPEVAVGALTLGGGLVVGQIASKWIVGKGLRLGLEKLGDFIGGGAGDFLKRHGRALARALGLIASGAGLALIPREAQWARVASLAFLVENAMDFEAMAEERLGVASSSSGKGA
jgi:hypothetical protein